MQTFSDINFIKQLQMQQKIRFNNEVRSEKLAALLISKRNFFLGKKESININAIISNMKLFIDDINIEEILKNLQLINDYVLDSSKEDLTYIYKNLCKNINELIDLLKNNDENYPLLSEISMFFINFSALLDDASDLNNFIEKIGEEFIEFLKQTEFLNLKNNLLIVFGNLCLKSFDATKILVNKFGFLQAILEILIEHNNDLNEKFLELIIWVLDILLESTQSPQYFIKDISLIINEISQIGFFSHLNQLNTFAKIFELCSENEITLIFSNTEFLFKKFLLSFSQYDEIKSKEISIFFSLLLHLSSFSEIIPNLVNMNIGEFLNSYLCKSPVEFQSKSLDIILNLFCHSSKTIKFLLHSLKNTIFNLMIYISVEEIMRKSLQSICICFICGDDEICFELLNKEIFGLILTSLDHWDIDHLILLMKTIEKILFYGQEIRNNTDEQNVFFELFCILKGEEQLEKMTMHPSKTISLMALHIIDKYF